MLGKLVLGLVLMGLCVAIHAIGLIAILRWLRVRIGRGELAFWQSTWRLIRIAGWAVLLHLLQIVTWAFVYTWTNAMPDFMTASYFSAVTYTTTGYGDLVLPKDWRLVGGIEALTGILMCGLSTGMFFAAFTQIFRINRRDESAS